MIQLEIVFEGEDYRHFVDSEYIKYTACGLPLIGEYKPWEVSIVTQGICWRCVSAEINKDDLNALKVVLDKALEWVISPNNPALQGALILAISEYQAWQSYSDMMDEIEGDGDKGD